MAKQNIYQHFNIEEHDLIEKTYDIIKQVEDSYTHYVTDFINPRQVKVMQTIISQTDLQVYLSSDYIPSEYARLLIAPVYYELDIADFEISLLEINYNNKFNRLTHAQILGTLLNKLGVKRQILGDIIVQERRAQFFIESSMVSYLTAQVSKIGKAAVSFKKLELNEQLENPSDYTEVDILVSSMRLDKVISSVLKVSRGTASKLIEGEKVKLNYLVQSKISCLVEVGDLVSIRGYGRFILKRDNGFSKSGKYKLTIDRITYKHK
ncbi:RNA-binding protein [Streptococcus macacae]|uniref:S4 domain protein n=1 Tax=Streptococcus macacae NCTC 11558 TaxID=764298 RepID=G5JVZ2_9STRE|nr:RNA-binding protein [Streptococcus macacae]EHJ52374.1 S4 domain protein [Streptococcus macacae NCTC 11558]SUN78984.1 YlmH protein [Streptococcus macacae NCTC 11558]